MAESVVAGEVHREECCEERDGRICCVAGEVQYTGRNAVRRGMVESVV